MKKDNSINKIGPIILFILSFSLMFLGFYRNQWHTAPKKKFSTFQKDVEGYVLARIMLSRQSGVFSDGGLLGWMDVDPLDVNEDDYEYQYDVYLDDLTFTSYWRKESHPGFQGILFSVLDLASPFSSSNNLRLFRIFTSGLFAMVLAGFVVWFFLEFGSLSAIFVLVSILSSQWMTVFGRNLFFISGLFYLPTLVLLFRLQKEKSGRQLSYSGLFGLVFIFILIKCLFNGYDFILPTLGMVASPIVYYGILETWDKGIFTKRFLIAVAASLSAVLVSLSILSIQIMAASGTFQNGITSILKTIARRIVNNTADLPPVIQEVNSTSVFLILKPYLNESYFFRIEFPYFAIIILFVIISAFHLLTVKLNTRWRSSSTKGSALIAVTWFSLLGPLSWYTIFKTVSYFHTHMNYLPWHMPFTLFGFGLCGYVVGTISNQIRKKRQ